MVVTFTLSVKLIKTMSLNWLLWEEKKKQVGMMFCYTEKMCEFFWPSESRLCSCNNTHSTSWYEIWGHENTQLVLTKRCLVIIHFCLLFMWNELTSSNKRLWFPALRSLGSTKPLLQLSVFSITSCRVFCAFHHKILTFWHSNCAIFKDFRKKQRYQGVVF